MSKKERRLYIFLAVIFVLYVVVEQYKPEPLVWIPTFAQKDKQPYGGYVLYEQLDDFFAAKMNLIPFTPSLRLGNLLYLPFCFLFEVIVSANSV